MKYLVFLFVLLSTTVIAQVSNDDCSGAIDLGSVPSCNEILFSNLDATASIAMDTIGGGCTPMGADTFGHDVWFTFSTTDQLTDINLIVDGNGSLSQPQVAIYSGTCDDNLNLVTCISASEDVDSIALRLFPLDPGATYYLRVSDYDTTGQDLSGSFSVCLTEYDPTIANILNPDTIYLCLGDSVVLIGDPSPPEATYSWSPAEGLNDPSLLTPIAKPTDNTIYTFTVVSDDSTVSSQVYVHIDSLPAILDTLIVAPVKDPYCAGEIIAIFSPSFTAANFPNITFSWLPNDGTIDTDSTNQNVGITLQDTTTYIRTTINGGCMEMAEITVNVIPPQIPLSVTDTILCPDLNFQVVVEDPTVTDLEWDPVEGLSCDNCPNPIVTVIGMPGSTQTHTVMGTKEGCPVGAEVRIQIPAAEVFSFGSITFCTGDDPFLIDATDADLSDYQWSVVSGDASLSCDDCPNPMITPQSSSIVIFTAENTNLGFCGAFGQVQFIQGNNEETGTQTIDVCPGDPITLSYEDQTLSNYVWSTISGNAVLSCTECPSPSVTATQVSEVVFTAVNDKAGFCTATRRFIIAIIDEETISTEAITVCQGNEVTLDYTSLLLENVQVSLDGGDLSCNDCLTPTITLTESQGTLTFVGNLPGQGCFARATIPVFTFPSDNAVMECMPGDNPPPPIGSSVMFAVSTTAETGIWTLNGVELGATSPSITIRPTMLENTISFQYVNQFGCVEIVSKTYQTVDAPPTFPTIFTPNGDDLNDNFRPITLGTFTLETLIVYNRWGQKVFEGSDGAQGWDGRVDGKEAASDTYVYFARLTRLGDGERRIVEGDVTLVR